MALIERDDIRAQVIALRDRTTGEEALALQADSKPCAKTALNGNAGVVFEMFLLFFNRAAPRLGAAGHTPNVLHIVLRRLV